MKRAIALAERARGKTEPNPMVGCVIVDKEGACIRACVRALAIDRSFRSLTRTHAGEVVGEGYHPAAGEPHAEVFALRAAGNRAEGAVAYVTLEPCNHFGRTPPCSLALVAAGVSKVVVGMVDPNPLVSGSGVDTLRENGIEVVVGVEEETCMDMNVGFIERMKAQQTSK